MDTSDARIAVIGCGNMGSSLLQGLIQIGMSRGRICGVEPDAERGALVNRHYGIDVHAEVAAALEDTDLIILAVKPQQADMVLAELATTELPILSIMAGIRVRQLQGGLGRRHRVVRAMPNLASQVLAGVTVLYSSVPVDDPLRKLSESIMRSVGTVLWIEHEGLMDAATAVSGCGPGYFFLLTELLERYAANLGFAARDARHLALQTAFGAAKLAISADADVAAMRHRVCSPGGATEAAMQVLLEGGLDTLMVNAMQAAYRRSGELGDTTEPSD